MASENVGARRGSVPSSVVAGRRIFHATAVAHTMASATIKRMRGMPKKRRIRIYGWDEIVC